jgi:Family of unknown function (DUF6283)
MINDDIQMKPAGSAPCDECPWRRNHPGGWLGGFPAVEFVAMVQLDIPVACHKTCGGTGRPSLCVGALQHYKNRMKSPRRADLAEAVDLVDENALVFDWPREFLEHHMTGPFKVPKSEDSHFDDADRETLSAFLDPAMYLPRDAAHEAQAKAWEARRRASRGR